jgi:hypothetical protein
MSKTIRNERSEKSSIRNPVQEAMMKRYPRAQVFTSKKRPKDRRNSWENDQDR